MLDLELIADARFVVEGLEEVTLPSSRHELVTLWRRRPGTEVPANV